MDAKTVLYFKKCHPNAYRPTRAHETDSGYDLYSIETVTVRMFEVSLIHTGLTFVLPSPIKGFTMELQIRPRSGLATREGLIIVNSPGTIDNGYRGEVVIGMTKITTGDYTIHSGDRVAQAVLCPIITPATTVHIEEYDYTDRGEDGFGSSGV